MFTNTMLFNSACETETSRRRRLYAENSHSEYIAETHTNEKEIERIAENSLLMPLMRDAWVDGIPAPSTLWHGLWNEGEIACLFGDPNIGKSLLANQIANEAAAMGHQVLYVDFENPDIHFHSRYTTKEETFVGNYGNIRYVGLRFDTAHSASYTIEQKFQAIQDAILVHRTPVVIIDDISHILPTKFSERSQSILHQLRHLAQNWHVAILVLAHTRYHRPDTPLSITHLAGSREFSFAFDSIFALGKVTNELPATDDETLVPTLKIRVAPSAPSCSECSELLRVLKKSYRQKIHHPQKIRVLRAAPSAPKKAIAPKKSPPKAPHPLPSQAPIVRYSASPPPPFHFFSLISQ